MFDWITPLAGLISDALTTGQDFVVTCEYGGNYVRDVLNRARIRAWGMETIGDEVIFRVRHQDARRTDAALRDAGL